MLILDIETTGLDPKEACMVSLGAEDLDTGKTFYGECHIYGNTLVSASALKINGFTEEQIRNPSLPAAHELYWQFLDWSKQFTDKVLGGHNIGHFDVLFLEEYHKMLPDYIKWPFGYRTVDLHSVAYGALGESLNHAGICRALNLPVEIEPHNALSGAQSEANAFRMLFVHNRHFAKNVEDILG